MRNENEIISSWDNHDSIIVTIVAITFNHAPYLDKAIQSMLAQETDFAFEIIIRDDASTDGSQEIIQSYVDRYPHIIKPIYEPENTYSKGVVPFKPIFSKARGEFIALLETDDYWINNAKLATQVAIMRRLNDVSMTFQNAVVERYNDANEFIGNQPFNSSIPTGYIEPKQLFGAHRIVPTGSVLYRNIDLTSYCDVIAGLPAADTPIFLKLATYGRLYYDDVSMSAYRSAVSGVMRSSFHEASIKKRFIKSYKFFIANFAQFGIVPFCRMALATIYRDLSLIAKKEKNYGDYLKYTLKIAFFYPEYIFKRVKDKILPGE